MRKHLVLCALVAGCSGASKQTPPTETAASPLVVPAVGAESASDPVALAVASANRTPDNRARDDHRHPAETLRFFGVKPGQQVIELWPGRGWYTEILAPLVGEQGKLTAVAATGPYLAPFKEFLAAKPDAYGKVALVEVQPPEKLALGPDGSADVVLTFRNLHGFMNGKYEKGIMESIFRVLKPGGVFGLTEHRAKPGTTAEESVKTGYVSEEVAIALATAAGFVLEEKSEINANPKDSKDYPNGVWSLPPTLRGGETDKDKFVAIGESDRMTLRFRKPE